MLENLSKNELLYFLNKYNTYVQEFYDEHEEGMIPVSVYEFYDNEYQVINNFVRNDSVNYYLRNKFIEQFVAERTIDDIMDLCSQDELNEYIIEQFKENVGLEEYRDIFDDLSDEEFEALLEDFGFNYTIEEYNKECGFDEED